MQNYSFVLIKLVLFLTTPSVVKNMWDNRIWIRKERMCGRIQSKASLYYYSRICFEEQRQAVASLRTAGHKSQYLKRGHFNVKQGTHPFDHEHRACTCFKF